MIKKGASKTEKSSNRQTLGWIFARTKKYTFHIILLSAIYAVIAVSAVYLALVSKDVIDIATGAASGSLVKSGITLFALVLLQIVLSALSTIVSTYTNGKLTISIRNHLFSSLVRKKFSSVSTHHSGDILNCFTSDVDVVVGSTVSIIPSIVSIASKIIAGMGALISLNKTIAIIILVLGVMIPAFGRIFNRKYKYLHKECQKTEGQSRSFLQECFQNIVVIKSFTSEKPFTKKLNQFMSNNFKLKMKRSYLSIATRLGLYSLFTFGYYAIMLWGAGMISAGAITFGTLTAFLQLVSQLRGPLENVSGIIPQYYSAIASSERLIELEKGEDEQKPLKAKKLNSIIDGFETLDVENLSFAYDNEEILKNCTFSVKRGKITAITGESGSGKSTLFKLMLSLYEPDSGEIKINGETPIDASLRGMFAYVPQGNMIISGTLRENITLCDDTISYEKIEAAAKAAVIYDFIMSLPDGFETEVSERGSGLSEGQVQRIAIARALLYDAPILLLDESTSALDEQTETQLLSNIGKMKDKTVLFITHRGTSLAVCDHNVHVSDKKFSYIK